MILRASLVAATQRLTAAGIDGAARDARVLLAHAIGMDPSRISLEPDLRLTAEMQLLLDSHIVRRIGREPVSKILGTRAFWGRDFIVTPDVLDPRPETESLIATALDGGDAQSFADLGTGSGIIALTLLAEWPNARCTATDASSAALAVAARNARALNVKDRLDLEHVQDRGSWFDGVPKGLDLIVSNPPYISGAEMLELSPEVFDHDPHLALSPGGDGLSPYRAIAGGAQDHLVPGGRLLVEIGWRQGTDVAGIFSQNGLERIVILPDMDGRDRVVSAHAPA